MRSLRLTVRTLMLLGIPVCAFASLIVVRPPCWVHGALMRRVAVPVSYGHFPIFDAGYQDYSAAKTTRFPNCDDAFEGGCEVGAERQRMKSVCPSCNAARLAWLLANPDLDIPLPNDPDRPPLPSSYWPGELM